MCKIVNNIFSRFFLGLQAHIIVWSSSPQKQEGGQAQSPPHSIQFYYAHRVQYSKVQFTRYFIKMCVHSKSVSGSVISSTRRHKAVSEGVGIFSVIIGQGRRLLGKDWQKADIRRGGNIQGEQIVGVSIYGARLGIVPVQSIKFEL